MTDSVIPLRFNVQQVGKHVKSSKKRFTWEVSLNSRQHIIVLDFSFISGKVKVAVDRKVLLQNQLPANTSFQYPFTLDGNSLNVIQQGESFELRINNKVFSHLYNQMKTNKEFKKYEDQVKDFKVNQNQFKAEKITLNIGGVGGGMKKKPKNQSAEGHTWNAFGGDEMSGFPNYFEGQTVSTSASQKVEQRPQVAQRKVSNDLLGDVSSSVTKQQEKPQNILDFEAQIQKSTPSTVSSKSQDEFNTIQLMFQTMNVNQQGQKQSVTVDNNEVDFFNNSAVESSNTSSLNQSGNVDFFADMTTPSVNTPVVTNTTPTTADYNTMRYMFATNAPNTGSSINQFAFNTSVNPKQLSSGLDMNWNVTPSQQPKQPENVNMNLNLNTATVPQVNENSFSTSLQGLFATNAMGINQPSNFTTQSGIQQQPVVNNQQNLTQTTNFNLNAQHFATQQIPTQAFSTSFNVNPQAFGTQSFMGQNSGSQQINFLGQQTVSQPVTQPQQSFVQQPVSVPQQSSEPNPKDFSSMQFLFQTMTPAQQNTPTPVIQQQSSTTQPQSFTQQFATTSGSIQSPNTMFMNTYGGSNSANLSFDLGVSPQQFTTSVNPSMMKKKAPETSPADLL